MGHSRTLHRLRCQRSTLKPLSIALAAGISFQAHALSNEREHRLQGVFCNTEGQIDQTVAYMAMRLPPGAAVELVNKRGVVCNYVDAIQYVVESPSMVGVTGGSVRLFKYQATLKAVIIGGAVREVSPPARVFFVAPEAIAGVPIEEHA